MRQGATVSAVARAGAAWHVTLADGTALEARTLALAAAPDAAAALLADAAPEAAALAGRIAVRQVCSEGVAVRAGRTTLPPMAGLVGVEQPFHSVVTRDTVPHADHRGFAFHFRPETDEATRTERICAVLGIAPADVEHRAQATRTLPAPAAGHHALIADLDARLAGQPLLLTGNWFGGLAIEDCVQRSATEAARLAAG